MPKVPGSGRKKGTPNKGVDIANPVVAEMVVQEMRAREADPSKKMGREILSTAANLMVGLARRCQEAEKDPLTNLPKDPAIRELFFKALHQACMYAHWVAPYESPTFKAVHLALDQPKMPGDDAVDVRIQVFDAVGRVIRDEVTE